MRAVKRRDPNAEIRVKIFEKVSEILGYEKYMPGNIGGMLGKKIKESSMTMDEIYDAIIKNEEYLKDMFNTKSHHVDVRQVIAIFTVIETIPESITYGGCYEIRNIESGEVYIGETLDFFTRMNTHISNLYANRHHCKALQDAFNKCHDISHFKFTPLYLYEIKSKNREFEKHNTLYLECAYYLKYIHNKKKMYNTINPYIALKENSVHLENYKVDCKKVLELLLEDNQNILPTKTKKLVEKDFKSSPRSPKTENR